MPRLCSVNQLEDDLVKANGDRPHGRLELDDIETALGRFATEEVVIVKGKPSSPDADDSDEKITVVFLIERNGLAVGKVTTTRIWMTNTWSPMTMSNMCDVYPDLVTRLNKVSYRRK